MTGNRPFEIGYKIPAFCGWLDQDRLSGEFLPGFRPFSVASTRIRLFSATHPNSALHSKHSRVPTNSNCATEIGSVENSLSKIRLREDSRPNFGLVEDCRFRTVRCQTHFPPHAINPYPETVGTGLLVPEIGRWANAGRHAGRAGRTRF